MMKIIFLGVVFILFIVSIWLFSSFGNYHSRINKLKLDVNNQIEKSVEKEVVIKYIRLSREVNDLGLKDLVMNLKEHNSKSVNDKTSNQFSGEKIDSPLLDKANYENLIKDIPEWINKNKLNIQSMSVVSKNNSECHIKVDLEFEKGGFYFSSINFYLLNTSENDWKIYKAEF